MVFSSLVFLLGFLPSLMLIYYLIPRRFRWLRNLVLLGYSLGFYWWGANKLVALMVLSIVINYVGACWQVKTGRRCQAGRALCQRGGAWPAGLVQIRGLPGPDHQ